MPSGDFAGLGMINALAAEVLCAHAGKGAVARPTLDGGFSETYVEIPICGVF